MLTRFVVHQFMQLCSCNTQKKRCCERIRAKTRTFAELPMYTHIYIQYCVYSIIHIQTNSATRVSAWPHCNEIFNVHLLQFPYAGECLWFWALLHTIHMLHHMRLVYCVCMASINSALWTEHIVDWGWWIQFPTVWRLKCVDLFNGFLNVDLVFDTHQITYCDPLIGVLLCQFHSTQKLENTITNTTANGGRKTSSYYTYDNECGAHITVCQCDETLEKQND